MVDAKALGLFQKNDIVGLFQYLGPMWIKVCMEILEDLIPKGFYPNPNRYKAELAAAGIDVERMEIAMSAALGKAAKQGTWAEFESANQFRLKRLPQQQQDEEKAFWFAGPSPGLSAPARVEYPPCPSVMIDLNPAADFTAGFVEGLISGMDPADYEIVKSKLFANPLEFYGHYVTGTFKGFFEGAKALIESLIDLFTLALNLTPAGITYNAIRFAVSETYRKKIAEDALEAKAKAEALLGLMAEFARNPFLYIAKSRSAGKALGKALAQEINQGVAAKSAQQIGDFVGEVVGRVLFEVILIVATEGIGEAVRGAGAVGEVARIAARVADNLRDSLEGLPALRRVFVRFLGESEGGLRLARWAERGAQLRLPEEGSGAKAVGKLWKEGSAEVEEFAYRSGPKGPRPPQTDLTQPPRHIMPPDPIPEGELNQGIPDHLKNASPEEKRKWLDSKEGNKWLDSKALKESARWSKRPRCRSQNV
jgi:hypothetical protein